jgi:hypothetical protein
MIHNQDYIMQPATDDDGKECWHIRVLRGDFVETVFKYGAIQLNNYDENSTEEQDIYMRFNFEVIYSPDLFVDENNEDLQKLATAVLFNILEDAETAVERATDE